MLLGLRVRRSLKVLRAGAGYVFPTAFSENKRSAWLIASCCGALTLSSCQTPPRPKEVETSPTLAPESPQAPAPDVAKPQEKKPEVADTKPRRVKSLLVGQAQGVGASVRSDGDGFWVIEKGGLRLRLEEESRRAELNGVALFLNEPFSERNGEFALSDSDLEYTLEPAMNPLRTSLRSRVIVLDPGHGGSERGTRNDELGLVEKELNLEVSLRLQKLLEARGYRVLLTRYDDRVVPLEERSKIANRSNAGVFVSVHFNAALNSEAQGIETFVLTPPGAASTSDSKPDGDAQAWPGNTFDQLNFDLGFSIQKALIKDLQRTDRGFKKARFKVLKDLECPGTLLECGFLSNRKEALLVSAPVYLQKLAESLAASLDAFMKRHQ